MTGRETAALSVVMFALLVTGLFPAATVRGLEEIATPQMSHVQVRNTEDADSGQTPGSVDDVE